MKIGISIALNGKDAVTEAVLAHYAGVTLPGAEVVLHAIGSSKEDRKMAEAAGWLYDEASNDNLGTKRNAGLAALRALDVDAVIRVGSDDLLSLALLERIAGAFAGGASAVTIKGSHVQDHATGETIYLPRTEYVLGIGRSVLDACGWALYDETHRVADKGISARVSGRKVIVLTADDDTPFLQVKTDKAINSFQRIKARAIYEPAEAPAALMPTDTPKPKRSRKAAAIDNDSASAEQPE